MTKTLLVLCALLASPAFGQAISGTFDVSFKGFNEFGVPTTRLQLTLECTLDCPAERPELHYRVNGSIDGTYVQAPSEKVGYISAFFGSDETGVNLHDSEQFPAGIAFRVLAKSATCHCGNAIGEGGYVDVLSNTAVIPPFPFVGTSTAKVGYEWMQLVNAKPKGEETVVVELTGAGVNTTRTLTPADFEAQGIAMVTVMPTTPGTITVTARLMPYGVEHTNTVTVQAGNGGGSGNTDAGTGNGDGDGDGDGDEEASGCSHTPGLLVPVALVPLLFLRRRVVR